MNGKNNLTEGSVYQKIIFFALPILVGQIFQQLYNTFDSLIVGRFLGDQALAAVSSSGSLIFMMVGFFQGVAMGAGVIIAKEFGAKNEKSMRLAMHTDVAFGLAAGVILTVLGVVFSPIILRWMNTPGDVLPQSVSYFRVYFCGSIFSILYNIFVGILQAVGDSRHPLYYLILSSMINVVLDLILVGGLGLGVWAAALATVAAQAISAALCLIQLLRAEESCRLVLREIGFHMESLKSIVRFGLPSGVQNSVIAFANVIVQSQINSFGKLAMAAYGTHAKIEGFAFLPITSFNMASTTFISQNLGARQYERAKKGSLFSILSAVLLAEAIGVCCFLFAPWLIGLFDQTPGVIELGVRQAHTVALFYGLLAFSHSVAAVCRGAGKAFVPMVIMLAVWCALRIAYIALVMRLFGDIGFIYWAYPLTWTISSIIYLIYYLCCDWVHGFDNGQEEAELTKSAE